MIVHAIPDPPRKSPVGTLQNSHWDRKGVAEGIATYSHSPAAMTLAD